MLEPVIHRLGKAAVRREHARGGLEETTFGELLLEGALRSLLRSTAGLHESASTVPIAVAGAGDNAARGVDIKPDVTEGADVQAGPRHLSASPCQCQHRYRARAAAR